MDEAGGNTKQVAEYRNLVQKQGVDAVIGYISLGSCLSVAPVAEELKTLTIIPVCGSPRLFEEGGKDYVFRTTGHAVGDGVAAALYVRDKFADAPAYTGINQNYAWGQDSYKFFDLAMETINPDTRPPTTRSSRNCSRPVRHRDFHPVTRQGAAGAFQLLGRRHGSLCAAGQRARLLPAKTFISTLGASAVDRLGKGFPEGVVMGTRGEYGLLVRDMDTPLNRWFVDRYKEKYGEYPSGRPTNTPSPSWR